MKTVFLDFDGVLFDTLREAFVLCRYAYSNINIFEPINEDISKNSMIPAFGLDSARFIVDKNDGFNLSGPKRISVKFIKNLHLDIEDIGLKKYHWSGEMNFAGLLIHARFQKINDQWYTICYVCPEIVEKSRY